METRAVKSDFISNQTNEIHIRSQSNQHVWIFFLGVGGKARAGAGIFLILRKSFLSIKSHWNQYSINEVNTCRIYPLNDTLQKVRASSCMLFTKLNFYLLKGEPGLPGARGLPVSNTFGIWRGFLELQYQYEGFLPLNVVKKSQKLFLRFWRAHKML